MQGWTKSVLVKVKPSRPESKSIQVDLRLGRVELTQA